MAAIGIFWCSKQNYSIRFILFEKAYPGKIVSRPGKYNGGIEWVED